MSEPLITELQHDFTEFQLQGFLADYEDGNWDRMHDRINWLMLEGYDSVATHLISHLDSHDQEAFGVTTEVEDAYQEVVKENV